MPLEIVIIARNAHPAALRFACVASETQPVLVEPHRVRKTPVIVPRALRPIPRRRRLRRVLLKRPRSRRTGSDGRDPHITLIIRLVRRQDEKALIRLRIALRQKLRKILARQLHHTGLVHSPGLLIILRAGGRSLRRERHGKRITPLVPVILPELHRARPETHRAAAPSLIDHNAPVPVRRGVLHKHRTAYAARLPRERR